ncbi:hypothetical protein EYF80_062963 [Liparis tanakae]|uniref:Uncharacterized protein n=1 Tax=Liparis tanakae TaxID=230148 RepID=A0A4Z2EDQ6_9TELE|nr:hypothetical protein EYF80_062963 [Liparis tanakae]
MTTTTAVPYSNIEEDGKNKVTAM